MYCGFLYIATSHKISTYSLVSRDTCITMSFVIYFEYLFLYSFCCLLWLSNSIFYLYLSFLKFMYNLLRHVWIQWDEGIPFCLHSISKFMQSAEFISWLAGSLPIDALSMRNVLVLIYDMYDTNVILTRSIPLVSFYVPWKDQKTGGFLMISGGIERDQWHKMG